MIKKFDEYINEGIDNLKDERKQILDFIGHNDWSVVMRKLNNRRFSEFRWEFEKSLKNIKLSLEFIDKYKDLKLSPSFVDNVLKNPNYTEEELVDIIEKFPDYINWYDIFYNKNIPFWIKKENYDKIYNDFLKSFDINVPMDIRIKNTKKALSILKED